MDLERERAVAETAANSLQRCRSLSDLSPLPLVSVDGTTHVVSYLNPAFAQLVGKEWADLVGRPFAEAVPEGSGNGCLALLDRIFRTGTAESLAEQEHQQTQPTRIFWSYSAWATFGADERPDGVMIQVTDSTASANFHAQAAAINEALMVSSLRQHELTAAAQSLSVRLRAAVFARDQFLAVLSHELRNPLATVSTGLQVLKLVGEDPAPAKVAMGMMERQLNQIVRLVDDLLEVSRISTGKLELRKACVDLASILSDAVEASRLLIDTEGHSLKYTPPTEPILLDADATRLGQVFLNLLNNAAKYSERGGTIWLSVAREDNEVVVRVRDTGIGIPADKLSHIFEVFVQVDRDWQRAQGGLGIGLALVKEFVGLHGGRVEVFSDGPGKGSEFVVRLPVVLAASREVAPRVEVLQPIRVSRRVLLVDDNRDASDSLAMMLELMGHEVRTADDGESGVAAAIAFLPQLVLMDIGMPRMNGYEAARRIRVEMVENPPFLVALTGWGSDADRQRTQEAGFDRHLVKPVDPNVLERLLAELPKKL